MERNNQVTYWCVQSYVFYNDLALHVTNQTNLYTVQHGKSNLEILEDKIRTFIAVLLLSGYYKVPYRDIYWADAPNTHNEAVSSVMTRNRFWEMLSNLHLADNTQITEDRYYKVHSIIWKAWFQFQIV